MIMIKEYPKLVPYTRAGFPDYPKSDGTPFPVQELQYIRLLRLLWAQGVDKESRTGIKTKSTFGLQMRFDLRDSFPVLTTKKIAFKSVVSELLWMIEGSGDERRLAEILHGSRDPKYKTIWTANAQADYWRKRARRPGDLGRIYGVQWRRWLNNNEKIDQLATLIENIKTDPDSRRHILSAWNVGDLDFMALPPCHVMSQYYISAGTISCHMYQRSADVFLGVPFNIASYALLTQMIAETTGYELGEYVHTFGDVHIYNNHFDQIKEQLSREPKPFPTVELNPEVKSVFDYKFEDVKLKNYSPHPFIKAPVAV